MQFFANQVHQKNFFSHPSFEKIAKNFIREGVVPPPPPKKIPADVLGQRARLSKYSFTKSSMVRLHTHAKRNIFNHKISSPVLHSTSWLLMRNVCKFGEYDLFNSTPSTCVTNLLILSNKVYLIICNCCIVFVLYVYPSSGPMCLDKEQ